MKKGYIVESLKSVIVEAQAGESSVCAAVKKLELLLVHHMTMFTKLLNKLVRVAQQFNRNQKREKSLLLVFLLKWDLEQPKG